MKLDELLRRIAAAGSDVTLDGDGGIEINGVAPIDEAQAGQITFVGYPRHVKNLQTTSASAAFVAPHVKSDRLALIKTKDPVLAFTHAVVILHGHRKHAFAGVHPKANVDPTASIGEGTVVYPGAYIGPHVKIGRDCQIYANVAIYEDCVIGDRVIVHANTTIGNDGFGFATSGGVHHKIPQIGNVVIEDDVEVGANCTIARAALASTVIGAGSKIDSQAMIAHNVRTGRGCIIVAQVGLAGSVTLGDYVTLAGQVGVAGHLNIGDKATIAAKTGVMQDVEPGATMIGMPAMPASDARRVYAAFLKLPEIMQRLKEAEQQIEALTDSGDTPIA